MNVHPTTDSEKALLFVLPVNPRLCASLNPSHERGGRIPSLLHPWGRAGRRTGAPRRSGSHDEFRPVEISLSSNFVARFKSKYFLNLVLGRGPLKLSLTNILLGLSKTLVLSACPRNIVLLEQPVVLAPVHSLIIRIQHVCRCVARMFCIQTIVVGCGWLWCRIV